MTILSGSDVKHIATLASLKLKKGEPEKFWTQLTKVIDYFEELKEVETNITEPTSQTTGLQNVTRDDNVQSCLSQQDALSSSDKTYNNYFVVPIVLEEKDF
ncbi:hypothetical protein A3A76_03215 [Candidatus Woesebacteria bacterium RIFCSPLOWO2_01_FULL_39_23]|uniref:Aspartyl/glutamyl-tRNA(Asn/Gln) amidotransferase subunit C n=1 Tax=Candidatus Woesebacteria bacterium RIFCSPHIGHO2_01_FULL_40_22 TaxID=1802499 RepID=A0A1F7YJE5_9BACT|nr:MAG: hypothetical protein A2141_00810 [Candidatus Woesebacteria bacterium RBG_16_40_11]OGM27471.1 MAG: hypothetical protein A2628_01615 [Candidatus Woesebacteria bacterium RIFCSPHIGHO2_01_FULL_40_22]OGM36571.1 MAG: hypothetical protein A3E41_04030 [Candidatus Woesebacteria bacterium RIFCSPHIGHO2_12_FULL_38_9]OGM62645.1 MAG: hypothetical protein A3A76_03215 [Candidatus Woesebacteria bacterium RIFCSPLOWO2_01_FULL_39_23]